MFFSSLLGPPPRRTPYEGTGLLRGDDTEECRAAAAAAATTVAEEEEEAGAGDSQHLCAPDGDVPVEQDVSGTCGDLGDPTPIVVVVVPPGLTER